MFVFLGVQLAGPMYAPNQILRQFLETAVDKGRLDEVGNYRLPFRFGWRIRHVFWATLPYLEDHPI